VAGSLITSGSKCRCTRLRYANPSWRRTERMQAAGRKLAGRDRPDQVRGRHGAIDLVAHQELASPAVTGGTAGHDAIRGLWYLLRDAGDLLYDIDQEATVRSQAVVTGNDSSSRMAATFNCGQLTGLDLNER
jgi:hypothetical protein